MPPHGARETHDLGLIIQQLAQAHQFVVDVLQSPGLAQMIDDLRDANYRASISADALTVARQRGLHIPDSNVAVFIRENLLGWEFEIQAVQDDKLLILGFNSTRGFYVR